MFVLNCLSGVLVGGLIWVLLRGLCALVGFVAFICFCFVDLFAFDLIDIVNCGLGWWVCFVVLFGFVRFLGLFTCDSICLLFYLHLVGCICGILY